MKQKIIIGAAAIASSFIMAGGAALAQSPSMSPTPAASPSMTTTVPSAAPATGFGGN